MGGKAEATRGRPPAASRSEVLDLALRRYLRGERVEVRAIATELGLARGTIYHWFGSREQLLGEVLVRASEPLLEKARAEARGDGAAALLDTFDRFNRELAAAPALHRFLEVERETALGVICASDGVVTPTLARRIAELVEDEMRRGAYEPPIEPYVMADAIVKLAQAFLFNHGGVSMRGDVDGLRVVEAALLGAAERPRR
jgi:AcrR family transcriptional regulator